MLLPIAATLALRELRAQGLVGVVFAAAEEGLGGGDAHCLLWREGVCGCGIRDEKELEWTLKDGSEGCV